MLESAHDPSRNSCAVYDIKPDCSGIDLKSFYLFPIGKETMSMKVVEIIKYGQMNYGKNEGIYRAVDQNTNQEYFIYIQDYADEKEHYSHSLNIISYSKNLPQAWLEVFQQGLDEVIDFK